MAPKLVWRVALRSNTTLNAGVHATQLHLGSQAARLGEDVLLDTLLLSRSSFLLKSLSAVSEFAIYFSEHLRHPNASYDLNLAGDPSQARPAWANACRKTAHASAREMGRRRGTRSMERGSRHGQKC